VLHKAPNLISVAVTFVPPWQWTVAGRPLDEQVLSTFWLDIKVTDGSDTKEDIAAYHAEIFAFMGEVLGPLHEESYVLVHQASPAAYGYGGLTGERRKAMVKLAG
jgi:4-oxalocrotonate tautomerase